MHKRLLIIAHCPSPNTQSMGEAILDGAQSMASDSNLIELRSPFSCNAQDVLEADALILFTTENFGYMSGALKDWFERIYYPCLDDPQRNQAKAYTLIVRAGMDGTGTEIAVTKIVNGLKWKQTQPMLLCKGGFTPAFIRDCYTVGQTMQASLEADLI